MVGTGRIELPTSSVSRKRSPTELRACKLGQDRPSKVFCRMTGPFMRSMRLVDCFTVMQRRRFTWVRIVQEIDFIINFSVTCQPIRVIEGARLCNQMRARETYWRPEARG